MNTTIQRILSKATDGERITFDEGVQLFDCYDLHALGRAAHAVTQRLHPEPYRTYNIDRNVNYTNICAAVCDFCAFYRKSNDVDAYVLPREELYQKIEETILLGGDQVLMQGGMHPSLKLEWYEELLTDLKTRFPDVNLHAFSPPELWHFHKLNKLPLREVLQRLKNAGMGSLPGGGGEILVDRVRKALTKNKALADEWLEVSRVWHELGGRSTCTMMFGHIETLAERVEHLDRLRQLQDETGGFTAFIGWTMQPGHKMSGYPAFGSFEYLRTQAIARMYLDNIDNIQSSWVTQGAKIGQIALFYGANDMGSLMIEENVVASAGTVHYLTLEQIKRSIREAGYIPRQRNVFYEYIDERKVAPRTGTGRMTPKLTIAPHLVGATRPIVALESTLIAHGLPYPTNLETALAAEEAIREVGAIPATIAVWEGVPTVGLSPSQIKALAQQNDVMKASRRDIAQAIAQRRTAATTVAATMALAHQAGIRIFATGGIGGVHTDPFDVSADLLELARTPVLVVCSGAKNLLDLPKTLEVLETQGVPVVCYRCTTFPAFYLTTSEIVSWSVASDVNEVSHWFRAHRQYGGGSGMVLAQPVPIEAALFPAMFTEALIIAEQRLLEQGIQGPTVTPFMLAQLAELTDGETLRANQALIVANAKLAAEVAIADAGLDD